MIAFYGGFNSYEIEINVPNEESFKIIFMQWTMNATWHNHLIFIIEHDEGCNVFILRDEIKLSYTLQNASILVIIYWNSTRYSQLRASVLVRLENMTFLTKSS